jgi:hypothetical protein
VLLVTFAPAHSEARPKPLFEPTDLEMQKPGVVELDLQMGAMQSDAWRIVIPDAEVNVGLLPQLEFDVDGAYAIEGAPSQGFSFDHAAPDNLWVALKYGAIDWEHESRRATAFGLQLGPKLPVARGASGVGVEGLLLLSEVWGESHLALNAGAFVDPEVSGERPAGLEGGLDLEWALYSSPWSITGELGGVHYLSDDDDQLHATAGLKWSPNDSIDCSVVALVGFLRGGDKFGLLLGVSPKFALWK